MQQVHDNYCCKSLTPAVLLLLLLQAARFDKIHAHTKDLVEAGPVPGIQSFCVYSEHSCRSWQVAV
jgi:hypothetical protein